MVKSKPKKNNDQLTGGIALIALGSVIMLNVIIGWHILWPLFIAFAGIMTIVDYFLNSNKDAVTGAGVLFTLAGFFLLFTTGLFSWSNMAFLWPGFLLAPGFGLLVAYIFNKDNGALMPAGILITLAVIFITASFSGLWSYWPIILIVIGLAVIIKSRKSK